MTVLENLEVELNKIDLSFVNDCTFDFRQQGAKGVRYFLKLKTLSTGKPKEKAFDNIIDFDQFGPEIDRDNIKQQKIINLCREWLCANIDQMIA